MALAQRLFVLVFVGVNDFTARTSSRQWADNLRKVVSLLKTRFQARDILLASVPPMHQFPALPQPLRRWLGARAKRLNRIMRHIPQDNAACRFIPVIFPADKVYVVVDGFHPGAAAYTLWADRIAEIIQSELEAVATSF
ncbi:SGNH/GDSL hydrolase family protein [Salinisphaera sp. LB1]|uniref:SGNH/GDSL hydrolase family protein n=1 Tax=Salinisphaera sp. LB1 TaxID=2183911 RepID=UPI0013145E36|nr:SGNH/GDSL hydrolase family protein [Salinisphaera sp. LB1]